MIFNRSWAPIPRPTRPRRYYFAVWAPMPRAVHLVGDFNSWNPEANPMERLDQSGIWGVF